MVRARPASWSGVAAAIAILPLLLTCMGDQDDSLERVRHAGQIRFAVSQGYPPFSFYNREGRLVGFDLDVAAEVARRLGVVSKPVVTEFKDIISGLLAGEYDGILSSMAVTKEREKLVNFSMPYYYSASRLMVRQDAVFTSPDDIKGKTLGVASGTTYELDARSLEAGSVRLFPSDCDALLALGKGELDGVVTDSVVGVHMIRDAKLPIKLLGGPLRNEKIAVAFRKKDLSLLKEVNKILKAMHEESVLRNLNKKMAQGGYGGFPSKE